MNTSPSLKERGARSHVSTRRNSPRAGPDLFELDECEVQMALVAKTFPSPFHKSYLAVAEASDAEIIC